GRAHERRRHGSPSSRPRGAHRSGRSSRRGRGGLDRRRVPPRLREPEPRGRGRAPHRRAPPGDLHRSIARGGAGDPRVRARGGEPRTAYSFEAARQKRFIEGSGLPIRISTIELIEIGAGGGSIAHVDEIGLLKVGPRSAGSQPGPACYGLGGTEPTVTDADLLLGYLNPEYFAGGEMRIDMAATRAALE